MPWQEVSIMSLRSEFLVLAQAEGANVRELCRRFGISPTTGYKWLKRGQAAGTGGLADHSRRPHHSPTRTPVAVEQAILDLRDAHPAWGPRKLRARLLALGHTGLPSPSTIAAILQRHGRIDPAASPKHQPFQRFEHPQPNDLWQMDFKGHFPVGDGSRCHPLTVLDDHSRFALGLAACADEQSATVQRHLTRIFQQYGLPTRILMDNGSPWGDAGDQPFTHLTTWLLRLDIAVSHGRPRHPQTQGKDERFHRTLDEELLQRQRFPDLAACQPAFDAWRQIYNTERPHQALDLRPPASRYQPSRRPFPAVLPPVQYDQGTLVRKVDDEGRISFQGRSLRVGKAFTGFPVALRETPQPSIWEVSFGRHPVRRLDLSLPPSHTET